MLEKREFAALLKNTLLKAAEKWKERKDIRANASQLDKHNPQEYAKQLDRKNDYNHREAKRRLPVSIPGLTRFNLPERILGINNLKDAAPSEIAQMAGKPVARLQTIPPTPNMPEGFATGFLVAPNLLLTNNHVFPYEGTAKFMAACFAFERTTAGIFPGYPFRLDPDKFFYTNEDLDFSLVYVETESMDRKMTLRNFKSLQLIESRGKILVGQPLSIIQHPKGIHKQYAFLDNIIIDIWDNAGIVHYSTDTNEGSSGSPGFNNSWEVAILHSSGVPYVQNNRIMSIHGTPWNEDVSDDEIQWIANQGYSISKIVSHLKTVKMGLQEKQQLLDALLESTKDPIGNAPGAAEKINLQLTSEHPDPKRESFSTNNTKKIADMSNIVMNFNGPAYLYFGNDPVNQPVQEAAMKAVNGHPTPGSEMTAFEKKLRFDLDYDNRPGYDSGFLNGYTIDVPSVLPEISHDLFIDFENNEPQVFHYHHFSLVMNKKRRFMMWSASNVNYNENKKSRKARKEFGTEDWKLDPRLPAIYQVQNNEFYKPATKVDRGHIVRRDDNCWGNSESEIEFANSDTFHWTNCTPQHERFNREDSNGLWGKLESAIKEQLDVVNKKAILFAGPVLDDSDPTTDYEGKTIKYPVKFWKVIVVDTGDEGLVTFGFMLDQSEVIEKFGLEAVPDFSSFKAVQISLMELTDVTKVVFDQQLYDTDILNNHLTVGEKMRPFRTTGELLLKKKSVRVDGAANLEGSPQLS